MGTAGDAGTQQPGRRRRVGSVICALACAAGLAVALPASAQAGGPNAGQIAAARAAAEHRAQQLRAASAAVAVARRELAALDARAEAAVERFDKAQVDLAAAARDERTAELVLGIAESRVGAAQRRMDAFAVATYESGGAVAGWNVLVSADGPAALLSRVGTLQAVEREQQATMAELRGDRVYLRTVQQAAAAALSARRRAAATAAAARMEAQRDVARQSELLARLQGAQARLAGLLRAAQATVRELVHERAVALARAAAQARAQAAARARALALVNQLAAERAALAAAASAAASAAPAPAPAPAPAVPPPPASGDAAAVAVHWAYAELGKPYVWGAAGPDSFDCSGLTMFVYAKAGISLLHWTGYQWTEGTHIAHGLERPGDLVFFATNTADPNTIHHVGIYIGNGEMINAPQTGEVVSFAPAFGPGFIGAVRPYGA